MKQKLMIFFVGVILVGLFFNSGCKTEEECTFDITGTWNFDVIYTGLGIETYILTFVGSTTSGVVNGFFGVQATYTVFNCNTVLFIIDAWDSGCHYIFTWDGASTSDTTMSGTLNATNSCSTTTISATWTATKI